MMNKLNPDIPLSDLPDEEQEVEAGVRSPDDESKVVSQVSSDPTRTNGDSEVVGPLSGLSNNNNNNPSQAYGGARPKTVRGRLRNNNSEVSKSRTSESSAGVDIRVISCDNGAGGQPSLQHQDLASLPLLEVRPSTGQTRENELEAAEALAEDDCYIYTYIGGTAYLSADLPNSFFRLDSGSDGESLPGVAGAGQSNLSTGVAALIQDQMVSSPLTPVVRSFSPDQDFIEMDFDPGSESDEEGASQDSGQGGAGRAVGLEQQEEDQDEEAEEEALAAGEETFEDSESIESHTLELEALQSYPSNNNITGKEKQSECVTCQPSSPTHPSSAPILSPSEEVAVFIPRSRSLNSSLGSRCLAPGHVTSNNLSICGSRLMQREALMFGGEEVNETQHDHNCPPDLHEMDDLMSALYRLTMPETPIPLRVKPAANRAMIWTEKEAVRKQITQGPNTSSCGATALVNVMLALDLDVCPSVVSESVNTRLRRPDSPLPDYLLSRSLAGCTHQDLISAVTLNFSQSLTARFFPSHARDLELTQWLAGWITLGIVPVLTLNVQKSNMRCPDGQPQDSWHHQMVWGVSGQDVYLANPLEVTQERHLLPQLDSTSDLLIRRSDVVERFTPTTDLMEINYHGPRWRDMNVLGQVVNILREERSMRKEAAAAGDTSNHKSVMVMTSHIRIPASYTAGITLFCSNTNREGIRCLMEAAELPLKK